MIADVEQLVADIEALDLEGLRSVWRERYGAPPPLRSAPILRQVLAWRVQAQALGGLGCKRHDYRCTAERSPQIF